MANIVSNLSNSKRIQLGVVRGQAQKTSALKFFTLKILKKNDKCCVEGRKVYEIEPCTHEYLDLQILYSTEVQSHKQLYTVHMSYSPLYSDNTLKRLFP
ncbi:hypothetical protein ANTRET_LOCUS5891 [Anthophora retusa]